MKSACLASLMLVYATIEQGPEGYLYLITDDRNGKLIQVKPAK